MRILQITPQIPYPPNDGGRIGIYNITKHLALRGHQITLVALTGKIGSAPELEQYCELEQMGLVLSKLKVASSLFSQTPYVMSRFHEVKILNKLLNLIKSKPFDIVHLDHLHTAFYGIAIKRATGLPVALREHNIESKIMERLSHNAQNPFFKLFTSIEARKLMQYEKRVCEVFDRCLMITSIDDAWIKQANPKVKTAVVPAGVDDTFFPLSLEEEPKTILFNAPLDWIPNLDSINWFLNEVFPTILSRDPAVKLWVIGRNPPPSIQQRANENVIVTGYVDDIQAYMARASVIVAPIRVGSGIRIKVLNALAMGKAVVSTSVGCEGIEVKPGVHLCVADQPDYFADQVVNLLNEPALRKKLGSAGQRLINDQYRWDQIAIHIEQLYQEAIKQ